MSNFFAFEADFVESLRCIPMQVRYKLDTCGIKLKLSHWHQFTSAERQSLVEMPCTTADEIAAYRSHLQTLVVNHTGDRPSDLAIAADPDWMNRATIPDSVVTQGQAVGKPLTLEQWSALTPIQRFVLIKLSRSNHENKNFLPALQEFHLA
ncbi:nitrate reductase associated protein [Oculatella sp. LEGE 06141]|uniref:nitrate reductase associated protein n=1 Tax=Oculatella sp. LEGE 06141 TaxID=1828648 RepID=UPI00187E23AE|nr:nitrate reductase associated protein [Oculatella sp. LEGE 06141]MBE9181933.1 nitrate reductase associated protein [Oculatella sp. LEGE 06141]